MDLSLLKMIENAKLFWEFPALYFNKFSFGAGRSITSVCNYGAKEDGGRKLNSRLSKTIQIVIKVLR